MLAFVAILSSMKNFEASNGIDFYNFWSICKAQKWSNYNLKSPYINEQKYADFLNSYANSSIDLRLKSVHKMFRDRYQDKLSLAGTPLCYWIFGIMPKDYSLAFGIFRAMQIILFIISVIMINAGSHENRLSIASLALLLVVVYEPLLSDLRVGNINSFQFFMVMILIVFADRVISGSSANNVLLPSILFMCGLVFMTLLKPNLILTIFFLSIYLWVLHGIKIFAKAALSALIFGAILCLLPCIYFDSWRVWIDWYNYLFIIGAKHLPSIAMGNYATVLLVSKLLGISTFSATVLVATMLITLVLGTLAMTTSPFKSGMKGLWREVVQWLCDPYLCAAVGITVALALMPLVWLHYYVMSLIPAIWLFTAHNRWNRLVICGGLSIILTSGLPAHLFMSLFGWVDFAPYSFALGWVPLWIGILATVAGKRIAGEQAGPSAKIRNLSSRKKSCPAN
jgi:hypothetical protein